MVDFGLLATLRLIISRVLWRKMHRLLSKEGFPIYGTHTNMPTCFLHLFGVEKAHDTRYWRQWRQRLRLLQLVWLLKVWVSCLGSTHWLPIQQRNWRTIRSSFLRMKNLQRHSQRTAKSLWRRVMIGRRFHKSWIVYIRKWGHGETDTANHHHS